MRLLIAGGGTGGHLYPGIAIAEEVKARGGEVLFVGTTRGIEARVVPAAGYPLELLEVTGLKRMGLLGTLRGLGRLPAAFWRSRGILRRFRPDVVLGVGGYASGPLVAAAALSRVPTAIQEQNSVPGFTNRTLGRLVRAVFAGFEDAERHFPAGKVVSTGNPVRRAFLAAAARPHQPAEEPRLLVVGGSQGAHAVNELVAGALEALARRGGPVPRVLHQTGKADAEPFAARYAAAGLADRVEVRAFVEDMPAAYADADLVVGRAGALTLAELALVGRPALLVPLPTAADDHQTKNAEAFARAGAALVLRQGETTPEALADTLAGLFADPAARGRMTAAMRGLARPEAAKLVVDRLEALAVSG
jgi:UDP-N-acetylglucosamine--N-acetylmuramyl-(pentapeptide) pyrophosphoryl-undecaprenol N-acetylglucosamine transferase